MYDMRICLMAYQNVEVNTNCTTLQTSHTHTNSTCSDPSEDRVIFHQRTSNIPIGFTLRQRWLCHHCHWAYNYAQPLLEVRECQYDQRSTPSPASETEDAYRSFSWGMNRILGERIFTECMGREVVGRSRAARSC